MKAHLRWHQFLPDQRGWIGLCLGVLLLGCGQSTTPSQTGKIPAVNDPLSVNEIDQFLKLVARLPGKRVPEFTPDKRRDREIDTGLPPRALVGLYRDQFRLLFDAKRQGELWRRDQQLSQACSNNAWTPAQLAGYIRSISCAVTRHKLQGKHDIEQLQQRCRTELADLIEEIERLEDRPRSEWTESFMQGREVLVRRLGHRVALLEYTEWLQKVPTRNLQLVERYQAQLQPLLPASFPSDPFLDAESGEEPGELQPVSHESSRP